MLTGCLFPLISACNWVLIYFPGSGLMGESSVPRQEQHLRTSIQSGLIVRLALHHLPLRDPLPANIPLVSLRAAVRGVNRQENRF